MNFLIVKHNTMLNDIIWELDSNFLIIIFKGNKNQNVIITCNSCPQVTEPSLQKVRLWQFRTTLEELVRLFLEKNYQCLPSRGPQPLINWRNLEINRCQWRWETFQTRVLSPYRWYCQDSMWRRRYGKDISVRTSQALWLICIINYASIISRSLPRNLYIKRWQ